MFFPRSLVARPQSSGLVAGRWRAGSDQENQRRPLSSRTRGSAIRDARTYPSYRPEGAARLSGRRGEPAARGSRLSPRGLSGRAWTVPVPSRLCAAARLGRDDNMCPPHRPRCALCAFLCVRCDEPLQAISPAIFRSASSNTAAGWPPLIRYLPSTTTAGTAVMPRARHRASASRTSAA